MGQSQPPSTPAMPEALVSAIPNLRAFAIALCRDANRADDLVQETLVKAWNKAFWQTPPEPLPAGHVPSDMIGATGALVTASLALTVFAGPLYAYTGRAAQALADRTPYIQAVLPDGDRGTGRSAHLASSPGGAG